MIKTTDPKWYKMRESIVYVICNGHGSVLNKLKEKHVKIRMREASQLYIYKTLGRE